MIALALACGPRLLFADEPTTALDVTVQAEILNLLQDQQADRFMAMVLVTHDLGVVAGRTDEIAVMYAGKIVEQAPTSVLFSQDAPPVHGGAAALDPEGRGPEPHPAARDHRPPARPARPAARAARSPRAARTSGPLPRRGAAARVRPARRGHRFACFYPLGTPENAAALERNLAAGLPQALALLDSRGGPARSTSARCSPPRRRGASAENEWAGGERTGTDDELSTRHGAALDE